MNSALPLLLLSQESKTWPKHKRHVSEPKYVKSGQDPLVSQFRIDCLTVFWRLLGVKLPEYPRRNMLSLRRSIGDENYLCLVRVNHPRLIMPFLLSFVPLERIHINRHPLQIIKSKKAYSTCYALSSFSTCLGFCIRFWGRLASVYP